MLNRIWSTLNPSSEASQDSSIDESVSQQDCLACRVVGSVTFVGAGGYMYWEGMKGLREREAEILRSGSRIGMGPRRAGVVGLSATLVGLGLYRWFR